MKRILICILGLTLLVSFSGLVSCGNVPTTPGIFPSSSQPSTSPPPIEQTATSQAPINQPTTSQPPEQTPVKTSTIVVSFEPNPVTITIGQPVHWKVILTETAGIGVTIKSISRQFYNSSGPTGTPSVFTNKEWFQNLPGDYLPPNSEGRIGAGTNFGSSTPSTVYAIDTITGIDDNGQEVIIKGRVDFTQTPQTTQPSAGIDTLALHQSAWEKAAMNCQENNYYKYSLYSSRSLAVSNPEVYLQADTLWTNMMLTYGGWGNDYLERDRTLTSDNGWWDKIGNNIENGFRQNTRSGVFLWDSFNWEEHRNSSMDVFDLYKDMDVLNWVDNRLVFLWSAMKGLNWKTPYASLAEIQYIKSFLEGKKVYLVLTEDRKGYVAETVGGNIVLNDPMTGETIETINGNIVLVMNNEHAWYPLMDRDDRAVDAGLESVVAKYCTENTLPTLTEFEDSIIKELRDGSKLQTAEELTWAKLVAMRAVNQYTWRATPLRELSAKVFPKRYSEDNNYSDSPYEQQCMGMIITEMGNRLSPLAAAWAGILQENADNPRQAFTQLGKDYLQRFHRSDSHSEWVYGDYYHCWLPNIEDKLLTGLGNCIVEATNTMAGLSLADIDDWEVYETNWWKVGESGGHVISGAYTPNGNFSLSNGLFQTNDSSVLNGPLWDINEMVAYVMLYAPDYGFVVTSQTKNAANFSAYVTPFTNLDYEEMVSWLQHIKDDLSEDTLIAIDSSPTTAKTIDEYIEYINQHKTQWALNQFAWPW